MVRDSFLYCTYQFQCVRYPTFTDNKSIYYHTIPCHTIPYLFFILQLGSCFKDFFKEKAFRQCVVNLFYSISQNHKFLHQTPDGDNISCLNSCWAVAPPIIRSETNCLSYKWRAMNFTKGISSLETHVSKSPCWTKIKMK